MLTMDIYKPNYTSTTLILDGAHAIRRAMYQPNTRELSNKIGVPTGAIYSFFNSLKSTLSSIRATSLVVTWEGGHSERRSTLYPDYKKRENTGEEPEKDNFGMTDFQYYSHQLSWIQKLLECYGIPQVSVSGKEGDDVLFQCCKIIKGNKVIVSEDRDFFSLVNESTSCYRPIKKEYVTYDNFELVTGYRTPRHFLYAKCIVGDGSDNIPAVAKGVGDGTVSKILERIEKEEDVTTENILKEAAIMNNSRTNKLVAAGASSINRNLDLIDISKESFDIFQLQEIVSILEKQYYPNVEMINKLFNHLDFSVNTINYITNSLINMSSYPLSTLVNKNYLREVAMGSTSII